MLPRLNEVEKSSVGKKGKAPGNSVVVQTESAGDYVRTTELYHPSGILSAPVKGERIVDLPIAGGVRIAVATHNYTLSLKLQEGEIIIHSTEPNTGEVNGKIYLKNDGSISIESKGNIDIGGDGKRLVTHEDLKFALDKFALDLNANFATKKDEPGKPGQLAFDISKSATKKVRTG